MRRTGADDSVVQSIVEISFVLLLGPLQPFALPGEANAGDSEQNLAAFLNDLALSKGSRVRPRGHV
jgi:hypothetical protein